MRSSIFCWRAPEMLPGAGLRRGVGTGVEPGVGLKATPALRRPPRRPAQTFSSMILGRVRLAFWGGRNRLHWEAFGLVCTGFPAALGRRGFGVGCSSHAGLFPHCKNPYSLGLPMASATWKIVFGSKLRGLRKLTQVKQRFPLGPRLYQSEGRRPPCPVARMSPNRLRQADSPARTPREAEARCPNHLRL